MLYPSILPEVKKRTLKRKRVPLSPVIKDLKAWRERNGLSQRAAIDVMARRGFEIAIQTLTSWEQGISYQGKFSEAALIAFLEKYPVITDPPEYPGAKMVAKEDIPKIRRMRASGDSLLKIAQEFKIAESTVSRICSTNPRTRRRAEEMIST